ncbi:MAG: glyoxalase [Alphaproteobacteria bacterium HGW-Alphaproteobacteria-2]|nr:MAG: glyoxalase [Alphaproteobacteria bacterium HGW-Alphaproteobacteria-2]
MTPERVSLVTLGCRDLARARAFYAALGWREHAESRESVAFYRMQGSALALFGLGDLGADQGRATAALGTGAITLAQNFPSRPAVDAAYAAALAAGATGLKAPEPAFWGGYSGYWADPDGHVWEVAHNPFWDLAEDGALILPEESGA